MTQTLSDDAEAFLAEKRFITVEAIRNNSAIISPSGIYGWWFDEALAHLSERCLSRDGLQLLYVGIAPSAPPKGSGKTRTLRDRLLNHCRGPVATSTLRRTLAALLKDKENLSIDRGPAAKWRMTSEDELKLTRWMAEHARVSWFASPVPWTVEEELLKHGPRLPLNIRGGSDPYATELKRLKAEAVMQKPVSLS